MMEDLARFKEKTTELVNQVQRDFNQTSTDIQTICDDVATKQKSMMDKVELMQNTVKTNDQRCDSFEAQITESK